MKKYLFTGLMAALMLFGTAINPSASDGVSFSEKSDSKQVKVIVEVAKDPEGLTDEQVTLSQNKVINSIRSRVTKNFEVVDRYHLVTNAIVIRVGEDKVDAIRKLEGVGLVNIDKMHYKTSVDNETITLNTRGILAATEEVVPKEEQDLGTEGENITATTLRKPSNTNEGEGTVIAVLDNEFYLKGKTKDEPAWSHATYKPLPEGTIERFTFDNLKNIIPNTHAAAKYNKNKAAGEEGSLYFNNKVPFYYDYGGTAKYYGNDGVPDLDVTSSISYHGSHVSSLIGGNANEYKGLAPKCQLVCMKVFTEFFADDTAKQLGLASYSGGYDTAILNALEDAITLGVDGINMSLGSDLDDFDQDSICLKTIGKLSTSSSMLSAISAGNSGKGSFSFTGGYGSWTTDTVETGVLGSYANSYDGTIIASAQPNEVYYENAVKYINNAGIPINVGYSDQIVNREGYDDDYPENKQMYLKDTAGIDGKVGWAYIPGFGEEKDYGDKNVEGKIAVVNRGSTSFLDKYNIALSHKAKGLIIINNDPTANEFNFRCSFGDGFTPTIPAALALFKDKAGFEAQGEGEFEFIEKTASINAEAKTVSTFTNDGARFSYDLKPDVAAPGDSIKGAIPPQKKEQKENTSISTYEYLSGTSMAAPNYAGSQSLVLSQKAKEIFAEGTNINSKTKSEYKKYRKTVDMRLMSTANMMMDTKENPETNTISPTSPRIQGAGLIDLTDALNTKVYINGLDMEGKEINKSKIQLRNNSDIAKGDLKMKFNAYNETDANKSFKVKLTVMRPALEENNKVIQDKYNYIGELDDISKLAGSTYWKKQYDVSLGDDVAKQFTAQSTAAQFDCVKITKQIEYFASQADCEANTNAVIIAPGYYYNAAASGYDWQPLPNFTYQSIKDVVIYQGETGQTVELVPGKNEVTLNTWTIPDEEKTKIADAYPYGCAIEGYVELIANDTADPDLSAPFLGFYSLADKKNGQTLRDAPVVEPFEFEKVEGVSYPSDLVNDLAKSLLGKNNVDMGSLWVAGYAENPEDIDVSKIKDNNSSFNKMNGFHAVGKNPANGKYFDNARDCVYVGSPKTTNTMIIQQFVMRSVADNYFTIKNSNGDIVYKSALEDMLYGSQHGKWNLYKSNVDSNLLGSGRVAHRAYAVIPLYDLMTDVPYTDGKYTIEFNYQLSYDNSWVSKSYDFIMDATLPSVDSIKTYDKNGETRVRINLAEEKVVSAVIGYSNTEVFYDAEAKQYYLDVSKAEITEFMNTLGDITAFVGKARPRLFIQVTDAAYGTNKMIIHFNKDDLSEYDIAEGSDLAITNDFDYQEDGTLKWVDIDADGVETAMESPDGVNFKSNFRVIPVKEPEQPEETPAPAEESKGCGGSIVASSSLVLIATSIGLALLLNKKRKMLGGQK